MQPSKIYAAIGFGIAAISVSAGVLVLTGIGIPASTPGQMRIMFGIVLILLGFYRASITYARGVQQKRELFRRDDDE